MVTQEHPFSFLIHYIPFGVIGLIRKKLTPKYKAVRTFRTNKLVALSKKEIRKEKNPKLDKMKKTLNTVGFNKTDCL